jgi:RNA polymerase sigma factor (sigma-70 family)
VARTPASRLSAAVVPERVGAREGSFEQFVDDAEPRLRRALCASYGAQVGREATVDALAYAWEHWHRLASMANPVGYLYRVGETSARRQLTRRSPPPPEPATAADMVDTVDVEPGLDEALAHLSPQQRAVVVLVHGFGYPLREVAATLEVSLSTVRNHLARAMTRLRRDLEVDDE